VGGKQTGRRGTEEKKNGTKKKLQKNMGKQKKTKPTAGAAKKKKLNHLKKKLGDHCWEAWVFWGASGVSTTLRRLDGSEIVFN